MPTVYLICGFIGSGKTTLSKKLAQEKNAFRFSIDEWMIPLYGEHMDRDVFDARFDALTERFKEATVQLIQLGTSVIFDFGFWSKQERTIFKDWAQTLNCDCEIIYLDCSFETCQRRALKRNELSGNESYDMTSEMLEQFWSMFEIPSEDECTAVLGVS